MNYFKRDMVVKYLFISTISMLHHLLMKVECYSAIHKFLACTELAI